ncbi:hypothetical protein XENOCAPTIV_019349 [Xenoophorus captivus]|uniref:Uncharacterized protein n=1 Tax=Xenoophorus captivus TaxID=1517983 RepID=A0ABV0RI35_9TELE
MFTTWKNSSILSISNINQSVVHVAEFLTDTERASEQWGQFSCKISQCIRPWVRLNSNKITDIKGRMTVSQVIVVFLSFVAEVQSSSGVVMSIPEGGFQSLWIGQARVGMDDYACHTIPYHTNFIYKALYTPTGPKCCTQS